MDNTDPVNTPSEQPIAPVVDEASVEAQQLEPASEPDSESDAAFVPGAISWSAAEYIEHERSKRWYLLLVAGAAALALISVFFLKDWMFAALIVSRVIFAILLEARFKFFDQVGCEFLLRIPIDIKGFNFRPQKVIRTGSAQFGQSAGIVTVHKLQNGITRIDGCNKAIVLRDHAAQPG